MKKLFLPGFSALLLASSLFVSLSSCGGASSTNEKPIEVTSKQLEEDYRADSKAADAKYKGKTLLVSGTVSSTGKNVSGDDFTTLALSKPEELTGAVQCFFSDAKEVSQLKEGQEVKIKGHCDGLLINVVVNKCSVVK